ncbi:MAG: hypothetical protein CMJ83_07365 [Planctomycetes bacterium]|nr:hypothetical protein [Planctomycetota bacterium]
MSRTLLLLSLLSILASAQSPMFQSVPVEYGSGPLQNPGSTTALVWSETVTVPLASSLILRFELATLVSDLDRIVV